MLVIAVAVTVILCACARIWHLWRTFELQQQVDELYARVIRGNRWPKVFEVESDNPQTDKILNGLRQRRLRVTAIPGQAGVVIDRQV